MNFSAIFLIHRAGLQDGFAEDGHNNWDGHISSQA